MLLLIRATRLRIREPRLARREDTLFPSHEPPGICDIRITMRGQMLHVGIPCICSFGAGARRCSIPCIPCIRSFGAGARRCSIPCIPCICSFGAGARRCSILRIPGIGFFGAGGRTCLPFAFLRSCSRLAAPPLQPLHQASPCQEIPDSSLASSHQGRSAAMASTFAASHAQAYHSCSRPGPLSAPCAVASSLHRYSLALLVSASMRSLGSVHSPP